MEENKKHMDAKEFFKLLDADKDQDPGHLDDFEKEALEGLRMMKDRSKLENLDTRIDEKLEELIAEDKKGNSKTGLYILSIAASIALVVGLFFVFKKSDLQNEVALTKETTGKDVEPAGTTAADIDKKLEETNTDAQLASTSTKNEQKPGATNPPPSAVNKQLENTGAADNLNAKIQDEIAVPLEQNLEYKTDDRKRSDKIVDGDVTLSKNSAVKDREEMVVAEEKTQFETTTNGTGTQTVTGNTATFNTSPSYSNGYANVQQNKETANKFMKQDESAKKGKKKEAQKIYGLFDNKKNETVSAYKKSETAPALADQNRTESTTTFTTPNAVNNNSNNVTLNPSGGVVVATADSISTDDERTTASAETTIVEAGFVGGKVALDAYIKKNLVIPATCPEEEIVIVKFIIDETGKVNKPKVVSKTGNCPDCEKEAIRFVKAMPAWIAATTGGKPFSSQKTLLLSFKK